MNLKWNAATVAASVLALASSTALGQVPPAPTKPQDTKPSASTDKRAADDTIQGRVRRVSKLLDCDVKNTKGEKIGEIEALVIDKSEGCVAYAVLSFGGFMGFGEKLYAMPFTKIVRTNDETCVVADVTKTSLEAAPTFTDDSWPTFDRKYGTTIHQHYKATPYWDDPTLTSHQDPARISKDALDKDNLAARGMVRAGKFIGTDVVDSAGKSIGDIDDVVIDDGTGRIIYAVLSFGGLLGVGDKLFALPWQSLSCAPKDDDKMVLDVAKDRLKAAPGFDKKSWPDMADHRWGLDIHKYYGQNPYWTAPSDKSGPPSGSR